jgi:hypothetical protein
MLVTPFQRLARTHSLMAAGDAVMTVALADSLFLSISPDDARGKVLLFLLVSFLPFAVVAPTIGPVIDRMRGGRRMVVIVTAAGRVVIALLMLGRVDDLVLFPLVFAALVLQKTYYVSKAALVPTVVGHHTELVEANSKLALLSGVVGGVIVMPAALVQKVVGVDATLLVDAALFAGALVTAFALPRQVVAAGPQAAIEVEELHSPSVVQGAFVMTVLRAAVGFLFFLLAFWLRDQSAAMFWFALALTLSALATVGANALAPLIRTQVREERILVMVLAFVAVASALAAVFGSVLAGVLLAPAVNGGAALGRLAFDSIVQRDAPDANRGRAFARFELRFQLAWVVAGAFAVLADLPGVAGFVLMAVVLAAATVSTVRLTLLRARGGPATGPGRRARPGSAARRRR